MLLFIYLIVLSFSSIGRIMRAREVATDLAKSTMVWALGVTLFIHVNVFFTIFYFAQANLLIWLSLGSVASLHDTVLDNERRLKMQGCV